MHRTNTRNRLELQGPEIMRHYKKKKKSVVPLPQRVKLAAEGLIDQNGSAAAGEVAYVADCGVREAKDELDLICARLVFEREHLGRGQYVYRMRVK